MLKRLKTPSIMLFLAPIIVSIGLFAFINFSCQASGENASGSVKLLYTSEVGGKLDPCG
jgi:hypothetical protein